MTENSKAPMKTRTALYGFLILVIFAPFTVGVAGDNYRVRVLDFMLLYVMLVLGLDIVMSLAGLFGLGYIVFYAVGAYTIALLGSSHLSNQPEWIHNLSLNRPYLVVWQVIPLRAGSAALLGILLGTSVLKLCGNYLAIVALGFGEIIRVFMNNLDRLVNITNGSKDINLAESIKIFGLDFSKHHDFLDICFDSIYMYYCLLAILVAIAIIVYLRLQNSRIGRAWVALRKDEITAKAMSTNTRNIKLLTSAMGTSFGGAPGAMFALFQSFTSSEPFMLWESTYILVIVMLSDMGCIPGAILSSILLVGFQELLCTLVESVQNELFDHVIVEAEMLRQLSFGLAMMVVILHCLSGLWPSPRKEDRPQRQRADGLSRI